MTPEIALSVFLDDDMRTTILTGDETLKKAISGKRTEAAKVWSSIADGTADIGRVLVWSQHVSKKVKREVIEIPPEKTAENPKARGQQALIAIGLSGDKKTKDATGVYDLLDSLDGFENLDNPNEDETHKIWVGICRSHGLLSDLDDTQAYRLIRDIRQGKR
ncbi:MAG: hypothetical protein IPF44_17275 [Betaproteobacteria bacterium]|nr:hypothetical protein [Betaproteobacteria bacterium]